MSSATSSDGTPLKFFHTDIALCKGYRLPARYSRSGLCEGALTQIRCTSIFNFMQITSFLTSAMNEIIGFEVSRFPCPNQNKVFEKEENFITTVT